ncbi:hypothetical protein LDO26_02460 [Luteimonas sp. BDR2-5]|uniref:hypothetical protein n=1 Tax=Proluteimonas luteida TaxID=2878685 RepID=UPI001E4F2C91|nr:hypothetical protein [Luteimonas sp. BDR2-5]MCD9027076.1 hypothetical protein [Luteimonas sp. BDR2-5]
MSRSESPKTLKTNPPSSGSDDVAGLFSRLGKSGGYRDFSEFKLRDAVPAARTAPVQATTEPRAGDRAPVTPVPLRPVPSVPAAPLAVPPAATAAPDNLAPPPLPPLPAARDADCRNAAATFTPLEQLFRRLAHAGPAAAGKSPLVRLRGD